MKQLISILCVFVFFSSLSGQEWKVLDKQAEKQKELATSDVVILLDSTGVNVAESGSGSFSIRKVLKIQTLKGALEQRIVKYDYDPLTAFAEFEYVKIYKPDGTIINLSDNCFYDYVAPARAIYWGARQIMAETGRLEAGDIIDYKIIKKGFTYALLYTPEEDERFIPPMHGEFYDIVPFWSNEPVIKKVYRLSIPKDKPLQYQFYQGTCVSSLRFEGERKVLTCSMNNILPFKKEPNMVDLFDAAPKLMLSSTYNWKEKSLWFYNVNEDYGSFNSIPEAQKKVDELIKGIHSEMDKISILTHWVADNMRYSGISMGKGEGYTLHNTTMNFTDRCGVCKDKAALLISMLRMAGFEAYPAMTMAGSRVESMPADHFNHSVAVVKLSNGNYIPLDPTWVPFIRELWSSAEQQQNYLPGLPEGSDLLITPVSAAENHYFKIRIHTTINSEGLLSGTLHLTAEGQSDGTVRRVFTSGFMSDWRNSLEAELLKVFPQATLLGVDYGKNPKDYMSGPINISMRFSIPNYAIAGNGILIFKPLILTNLYNSVRSYLNININLVERQYGFKDACSRYVELSETIVLPKGYKMKQADNEIKKNNDNTADFLGYIKQIGNRIVVHQQLTLKKRIYEANEWPAFREVLNAHKIFAQESLIVEEIP